MSDYVKLFTLEEISSPCVEVILEAGAPRVMATGEKMNAVCPDAYMNGYNWETLFRRYLEEKDPDILEGMKTDPEADMYVAYWPLTPENEARAGRFETIVRSLIEDEEAICRFVEERGEEIEWD